MLDSIVLYWWSIIYQWWYCGLNMLYVIGFTLLKEGKYCCRFELYEERWSIIGSILIIAACHAYCIILSHFEVMSWSYGPTVPVQLSIVRCPRRGTVRLHTLRGVKAEVTCIAFICIHWSDKLQMLTKRSDYTTFCGCSKGDGILIYWNYWILRLEYCSC